MSRELTVISSGPETPGQRVLRLKSEAREAAAENVHELLDAMGICERLAREVATGGDPYPSGIRELARRFAAEVQAASSTIISIGDKT